MIPIYVPSRGRAGDAPTIEGLVADGLRPVVVVPMEESKAYADAYRFANVVGVGVSGIGRVRQWILQNARHMGYQHIWMLDDDMTVSARKHFGASYRAISWNDALFYMEDVAAMGAPGRERLALVSPMPRQFAWSNDGALWNRRCGYAVMMDVTLPFDYWPFYHEDTDVNLQLLTQTYKTLLLPQICFSTPAMGTKKGGCQDGYVAGEGIYGAEVLIAKWQGVPGLVTSRVNKAGATVTKVDWARFREVA